MVKIFSAILACSIWLFTVFTIFFLASRLLMNFNPNYFLGIMSLGFISSASGVFAGTLMAEKMHGFGIGALCFIMAIFAPLWMWFYGFNMFVALPEYKIAYAVSLEFAILGFWGYSKFHH